MKKVQVGGEGWLSQEELYELPKGARIEVRWPGIDPKSKKDFTQCVVGSIDGRPCALSWPAKLFAGYLTNVGRHKKLHTRVRLAPEEA